jgi:hypothetical protein
MAPLFVLQENQTRSDSRTVRDVAELCHKVKVQFMATLAERLPNSGVLVSATGGTPTKFSRLSWFGMVPCRIYEEAFMTGASEPVGFSRRLILGFVAGFFATLIFHQLTLAVLWGVGLAPFAPFSMAPTHPFGLPAVFSLAFWGGVWGILFALIHGSFPRRVGYWVAAFGFGAILPSLVALLIVLPLKGRPMGGGWHLALLVTAFLINGAWGIGTGVILRALQAVLRRRVSNGRIHSEIEPGGTGPVGRNGAKA